jgi:hypothetical protein
MDADDADDVEAAMERLGLKCHGLRQMLYWLIEEAARFLKGRKRTIRMADWSAFLKFAGTLGSSTRLFSGTSAE